MYSDDANNVTIEAFQALLMQVVYGDVAVEIDSSTRYVTIEVDDGTIVTTVQTEVHVVLFDAYDPVISNSLTSFNFTEDSTSPVPLVSPSLTLSDLDNNVYFLMGNATISLTPIPASTDENVSVDISSYPFRYDPIAGGIILVVLFYCYPQYKTWLGLVWELVLSSLDNTKCFFPLVLELVLVITVEHHHQDGPPHRRWLGGSYG